MSLIKPRPEGIDCPDWESADDIDRPKKCRYIAPEGEKWRGACKLPAHIVCGEFLKVNPHLRLPVAPPAPRRTPAAPPPVSTNLFGEYVPPAEEAPSRRQAAPRKADRGRGQGFTVLPTAEPPEGERKAPIPVEWVESMQASGMELELAVGGTSIWVVKQKTGQDRLELTYTDLAFLRMAVDVFPAARVQALAMTLTDAAEEATQRKVFDLVISDELRERLKRLDPSTGVPKDELAAITKLATGHSPPEPEPEDWE